MLAAKASTVTEVTCDNTTRSWHTEVTEVDTVALRQCGCLVGILVGEILIQFSRRVFSIFHQSIMRYCESIQ